MSAITEVTLSESKTAALMAALENEFPSLNIDGKSGVVLWLEGSGRIVGWWPTKADALAELTHASAFGPLDSWVDDEIMYVSLGGDL